MTTSLFSLTLIIVGKGNHPQDSRTFQVSELLSFSHIYIYIYIYVSL